MKKLYLVLILFALTVAIFWQKNTITPREAINTIHELEKSNYVEIEDVNGYKTVYVEYHKQDSIIEVLEVLEIECNFVIVIK